jgi:hypothetical protein
VEKSVIHPSEIRTGVDSCGTVWLKLQFEAKHRLSEYDRSDEIENRMRLLMLDKIYGDANRAVSEMEHAVMTSLRIEANRDQIAAMFNRLREVIPVVC